MLLNNRLPRHRDKAVLECACAIYQLSARLQENGRGVPDRTNGLSSHLIALYTENNASQCT